MKHEITVDILNNEVLFNGETMHGIELYYDGEHWMLDDGSLTNIYSDALILEIKEKIRRAT